MSYLTTADYDRFQTVPIALPETELRFQRQLHVCTVVVAQGQRLEMACLTLHLYKVLTLGVVPVLADDTLGMVCTGLMASTMTSSALGLVKLNAVGVECWNPDQPVLINAPGVYRVFVLNNCWNVDLAVAVTGSMRLIGNAEAMTIPMAGDTSKSAEASTFLLAPTAAPTTPVVAIAAVPPVIDTQPTDQTVRGSTLPTWPSTNYVPVTFTVVASGDSLAYQWQILSTSDANVWTNLSDGKSNTYTVKTGKLGGIPAGTLPHAIRFLSTISYRCVVSNPYGSITSNAVAIIVT